MPVIYANDHFGKWHSDFRRLIEECREGERCARAIVELLEPRSKDFAVLKPRHSAFYGTPLEFLLGELGTRRLVIAGLETDQCILCTAQDAYVRKFSLRVPRNCVATRFPAKGLAALDLMRAHLGADVRRR
jgi:nicotinamidase-related amidase